MSSYKKQGETRVNIFGCVSWHPPNHIRRRHVHPSGSNRLELDVLDIQAIMPACFPKGRPSRYPVDEQIARQRLGQHWFISAYKAVYVQGLYTVYNSAGVRSTVAVLGLASNQGRRQKASTTPSFPCACQQWCSRSRIKRLISRSCPTKELLISG
jgi:hypothetical protein